MRIGYFIIGFAVGLIAAFVIALWLLERMTKPGPRPPRPLKYVDFRERKDKTA